MQNFHHKSAGFTLVELMVTVAIVSALAATAIPQYRSYVIRTRIAEGLFLATAAKTAVAKTYATLGPGHFYGASGVGYKLPGPTENVGDIVLASSGSIYIGYPSSLLGLNGGNDLLGIVLTPVNDGAPYPLNTPSNKAWSGQWKCSSPASISNSLLPAECRT